MSGLREDRQGARAGALRVAEEIRSGLRSDEPAVDDAGRVALTGAGLPIEFSFSGEKLKQADVSMSRGEWLDTADVLGFVGKRREFLSGQLDAALVASQLRAFIKRKTDLSNKGQNFGHLKSLDRQYASFGKWFKRLEKISESAPDALYQGLRDLCREEIRRFGGQRAAYHAKDGTIDFSEWNVFLNEVRDGGLEGEELRGLALQLCRDALGDPSWRPPSPPNDAAARAWEHHEERRLLEERRRAQEAEAERAQAQARLAEVELQRRIAEVRAAELKVQEQAAQVATRDAEAHVREVEAQHAVAAQQKQMQHAALMRGIAEEKGLLRSELISGGVWGFVLSGAAGVGVALGLHLFGPGSTVALLVARERGLAGHSAARLRAICAVGKDVDAAGKRLRSEVEGAVTRVPFADERARLRAVAVSECSLTTRGSTGDATKATTSASPVSSVAPSAAGSTPAARARTSNGPTGARP